MLNRIRILGANIRRIRKTKKIPQIELCVHVGIDRSYLSAIENGHKNPSIAVLYAIADAMEVDIVDILKEPQPDK